MSVQDDIRRIERDLDTDREDLAQSLAALKTSLTLGGLMGQGARLVESGVSSIKEQGSKLMESGKEIAGEGVSTGLGAATQMVKDNPLAAAAAGAGIGWIVKKVTEPGRGDPDHAVDQRLSDLFSPGSPVPTEDEIWISEADRLRERAADLMEMLDEAEANGTTPVSALERRRQEVRNSLAHDTRRVMLRGLEGLSPSAREKAFRKREDLYARHLGHDTGRSWAKTLGLGALVAGAGLTAALILPRTATENKALGEVRDKVVAEVSGFMKANPAISSVVTTRLLSGVMKAALRRL